MKSEKIVIKQERNVWEECQKKYTFVLLIIFCTLLIGCNKIEYLMRAYLASQPSEQQSLQQGAQSQQQGRSLRYTTWHHFSTYNDIVYVGNSNMPIIDQYRYVNRAFEAVLNFGDEDFNLQIVQGPNGSRSITGRYEVYGDNDDNNVCLTFYSDDEGGGGEIWGPIIGNSMNFSGMGRRLIGDLKISVWSFNRRN